MCSTTHEKNVRNFQVKVKHVLKRKKTHAGKGHIISAGEKCNDRSFKPISYEWYSIIKQSNKEAGKRKDSPRRHTLKISMRMDRFGQKYFGKNRPGRNII